MSDGRVPPHNLDAELSVLGAMLLSRASIAAAIASDLRPNDFYKPAHGHIFDAIVDLYTSGHPCDPVTVAEEITRRGLIDVIGGRGTLLTIQAGTPATSNAARYAQIIGDHATLRRLISFAGDTAEMAYAVPEDVAAAVERVKEQANLIELPLGAPEPSPDIATFLDTEIHYRWLVEGLIEEQDRLMLTGPEGGGKSTFFRQLAVCLAAGIHPFRFSPTTPCRVLVVDIENTAAQIQRKIRPLVELAGAKLNPGNLRLEVRTGGIDLTHRHDHRWLLERLEANRPQVLIIGPTYKLHNQDPNEEQPARAVIATLDSLRERFGCAILMEAHSGHDRGEGRPFGASIWRRWPEFGYGIWPPPRGDDNPDSMIFRPWRGARDAREFPARLARGGPGNWPWVDPDYQVPVVSEAYAGAGF